MKALAITLCLLLVVPAGAQQNAERTAPDFYVPYAASVTAPAPVTGESSSLEASPTEPAALPEPPQQRLHPAGCCCRHYCGAPYGYPPARPNLGAIVVGVVVVLAVAALLAGDH